MTRISSVAELRARSHGQGECQSPELDRACFCAPLGEVTGPVQSALGYHLVLVEERFGLERSAGDASDADGRFPVP